MRPKTGITIRNDSPGPCQYTPNKITRNVKNVVFGKLSKQ